jgi:hypothetical protein
MDATDHALLVGGFFARPCHPGRLQTGLDVHAPLTVLFESPLVPIAPDPESVDSPAPAPSLLHVPSYRIPVPWSFLGGGGAS